MKCKLQTPNKKEGNLPAHGFVNHALLTNSTSNNNTESGGMIHEPASNQLGISFCLAKKNGKRKIHAEKEYVKVFRVYKAMHNS